MKIIQRHGIKDYYDYMAFQYGGGDPLIVYDRGYFNKDLNEYDHIYWRQGFVIYPNNKELYDLPSYISLYSKLSNRYIYIRYISIAGRLFPITENNTVISEVTTPEIWNNKDFDDYRSMLFSEPDYLVELSRILKQPTFLISYIGRDNKQGIVVESKYPVLKNMGFPSIYKPEQIYQDLSLFISTKMKATPDSLPEPMIPLTNNDKILNHGFDVKRSFRPNMR